MTYINQTQFDILLCIYLFDYNKIGGICLLITFNSIPLYYYMILSMTVYIYISSSICVGGKVIIKNY